MSVKLAYLTLLLLRCDICAQCSVDPETIDYFSPN